VLSLIVDDTKGTGFGRFIRSGDVVAQHRAVIEVQVGPTAFDSRLRVLRVAPLPLKRNPAALTEDFSSDDIQIRNVTNPQQPFAYHLSGRPLQKDEFRLDSTTAEIVFGATQTAGEMLEVTHWTVTWRDDITGDRYRGMLNMEVWATGQLQADELARKLQSRLRYDALLLRQKGFVKMEPAQLQPAETLLYEPPTASAFPVWRQMLGYRFVFEGQEGGEVSSGGPIKRIDVDLKQPPELFSIS
jgi:hypothetical protein